MSHRTGGFVSSWKRDGVGSTGKSRCRPTPRQPSGCRLADPGSVTESGKPVAQVPGVKVLRQEPGHLVLEVVAGTYRFAAQQ